MHAMEDCSDHLATTGRGVQGQVAVFQPLAGVFSTKDKAQHNWPHIKQT